MWESASRVRTLSCREHRLQEIRELRALALLLVLEIDVRAPGHVLRADNCRPSLDVGRLVALVAQAEVRVVGRRDDGGRHLLAVGDAEREVAPAERVEDGLVVPREVPELER